MQLPTLSDGRVLLRAIEPGDLPEIEAGIRDPDVIRWIGPQLPTAQEVLLQSAQRWAQGSPTLAICDVSGTLLGKIWLSVSETEEATGSIGYWLVPAGRGRGLATSAVRLLSTWAADELGLTNLRITCAPDNERSQRVAERSGYLRTSQSADEVVYIKRVVPRPPSSGR